MSSTIKLAALAFISTAAAIPHYSHSRFHKPSDITASGAHAYPTGGWGVPKNTTALPVPSGTGSYGGDKTSTLTSTLYSTTTIVETIYPSKPAGGEGEAPTSVVVEDVSNVASTGAAGCGPDTVTVTATNQVTVTVTPGGEAPSSDAAPAPSKPAQGGHASVPYEQKDQSTPVPSKSEGVYSILPVNSGVAVETPPTEFKPSKVYSSVAETPSTPATSNSPKPTSPTYSGSKRGLAYNDVELCSAFGGGSFGFAYNWASQENGQLPEGVKYVPMMHRPSVATAEQWKKDVAAAVKSGTTAVMGFNEPDHDAQANLSPEAACEAWTEYMEPLVSAHPELTIVGPSVTNGPAPMGLDWLSRFQKSCPDATWHAANIHFYDIASEQTLDRFKAHVEKAAEQFGKPVWVTEFGLNPGASQEDAASFLKGCMEYMDGSDAVEGYSYFMVGTGENQLNGNGGLSSVGEVYASA